MAGLETRLTISAVDQTGPVFAGLEARINALHAQLSGLTPAVAGVSPTAAAVSPAATAVASAPRPETTSGLGGMMATMVEVAAAAVGLKAAISGVTQAFDQVHERARMSVAGMRPDEILDAERLSKEIAAKYPMIAPSSAMNLARNARSIVGTYEEAAPLLDQLAQLRVVAKGANAHASDEEIDHQFDLLLKGIEIRGATQHPEAFRKHIDFIAKGLNAFGDTLTPFDYYEMYKYGRQATPALSDKFMLETAPSLAQELKGSSYGRAVSAFEQMVVAGVGRKSSFQQLAALGLIDQADLGDLKEGAEGRGLKQGRTIKGWKVAQADPNAWVRDYLMPSLAAHGVSDRSDVMKAISSIFQNQVAGQMVNILAQQQARIDKDQRIVEGAQGSDAWRRLSRDPLIASGALGHALASRIATQVPAEGLGKLFDWAAHWLAPHPQSNAFSEMTPFELQTAYNASMQATRRADLQARFPGAFGGGVYAEDAERLSKHRIAESYRWQQSLIADPEAHRGAALMNIGQHAKPEPVSVSGEATVHVPIAVTVTASSELLRIVEDAKAATKTVSTQIPLNPMQGSHSGRMDSDAAPLAGHYGHN